jgi:glycosyltransferase involved in cell wall biosynthesis
MMLQSVLENPLLRNTKGVFYYSIKNCSESFEADRRILLLLSGNQIPLTWSYTIESELNNLELDKRFLNKNIDFDVAIFHCIPTQWFDQLEKFKIKFLNKKLIGYMTCIPHILPELWVKYLNLMTEIWVPLENVKDTLEKCGVSVPVKVVPYTPTDQPLLEINSDLLSTLLSNTRHYGKSSFEYGEQWKVYYIISELNDVCNIKDLIKSYCNAFKESDRVKLIIKTFHKDYSKDNVSYCISQIESVINEFEMHPEILLMTSDLGTSIVHSIGSHFVSVKKDEFSLNEVDAINYGKPIVSNFGDTTNCDRVYDDVIELNNGFYFLEKKNGNYFRDTSDNFTIKIGSTKISSVKVKFRNNFSENKVLKIKTSANVEKRITIKPDDCFEASISSKNTKEINFSTTVNLHKENNKDHRNIGLTLEGISICLLDGKLIPLDLVSLKCNNELTQFYFFSREEKILKELRKSEFSNINIVNVSLERDVEFQGITYIGQYGTSGYATAAKGNLVHFFMKGIPITWIPLHFDNSQLSDECYYNAMAKSLLKKPIQNFDTVFFHSTPDIWPEFRKHHEKIITGRKVIGYTVWETSKLPSNWVKNINSCVDEVWCPSEYNREVFQSSGVTIPIKVFPHVFLKKQLPDKKIVSLKEIGSNELIQVSDDYTFYNISEMNFRKGVEDLVKVFCESFTIQDKVRLVLKVHYKNYDEDNKKYCVTRLNDIISCYKHPPKIYFILNNLSEKELLGLHAIGDCYISLCKSEGFGLTIFEAFKYGKDVITTGYGGQIDFLGKDYRGLVKYSLGDVTGMDGFSKFYSEKQQWAYPDLNHAGELMKSYVGKL